MKRSDLIRVIQERHGALSRKEAEGVLDTMLKKIEESLLNGEEVNIQNLGIFTFKTKKVSNKGKIIETGKKFSGKRRVASFTPSVSLLNSLNKGHD